MILLWLLFLCIGLYFSLGKKVIPYLNITPKPKKYKTPVDYYQDVNASQGVLLEAMTNVDKSSAVANGDQLFKGDKSSAVPAPTIAKGDRKLFKGDNVSVYSGPNGVYVKGPNKIVGVDATIKMGGCAGTQYGCCPDNVTAKKQDGSNCMMGGCAGTQYGCCPDNVTAKNQDGSNCMMGGCAGTQYGCLSLIHI